MVSQISERNLAPTKQQQSVVPSVLSSVLVCSMTAETACSDFLTSHKTFAVFILAVPSNTFLSKVNKGLSGS